MTSFTKPYKLLQSEMANLPSTPYSPNPQKPFAHATLL